MENHNSEVRRGCMTLEALPTHAPALMNLMMCTESLRHTAHLREDSEGAKQWEGPDCR